MMCFFGPTLRVGCLMDKFGGRELVSMVNSLAELLLFC